MIGGYSGMVEIMIMMYDYEERLASIQETKAMLGEKDQMIEALSGDIILLQAQKDENKEHKH